MINFLIADCSEKGIREGLVLEGDRELEPIAVTLRHKGGFSFAECVSVSQQFGSEYTIYLEKKKPNNKKGQQDGLVGKGVCLMDGVHSLSPRGKQQELTPPNYYLVPICML